MCRIFLYICYAGSPAYIKTKVCAFVPVPESGKFTTQGIQRIARHSLSAAAISARPVMMSWSICCSQVRCLAPDAGRQMASRFLYVNILFWSHAGYKG